MFCADYGGKIDIEEDTEKIPFSERGLKSNIKESHKGIGDALFENRRTQKEGKMGINIIEKPVEAEEMLWRLGWQY